MIWADSSMPSRTVAAHAHAQIRAPPALCDHTEILSRKNIMVDHSFRAEVADFS